MDPNSARLIGWFGELAKPPLTCQKKWFIDLNH